ncbi:hypothetical protein F4782DRAFT_520292 [Xylaria castorea]|nr:hypothetical protein F4782DRAFT_520292 [Xylaria castorea]
MQHPPREEIDTPHTGRLDKQGKPTIMDVQQDNPNELAMRSAEEELRRRRERGRQSQARFRKRQAQSARETQAENERFRAAIADIVNVAGGGGGSDRPGPNLLNAIRAAADVAGVDASALEEGNVVAVVNRGAAVHTLPMTRGSDSFTTNTPPRVSENRSASPGNRPRGGPWRSSSASTSQSSGRLSPRLDYGIWVDSRRATKVFTPPHEIVPFLGPGRWTFAGQLYWACADYMISLCRLVTSPHTPTPWFGDPSRCPKPREAEDRVWDLLQHSPPLRSVGLAQALAESQRAYRDKGWIPGDSPVAPCGGEGEDIGTLLRKEVEADYAARGHDLSAWMTISQLEGHMRRQLGAAAFERLERATVAIAVTNSPTVKAVDNGEVVAVHDEEVRAITRVLIRNLAESYTCFGDGPRWKADSISILFTEKMAM